MGGGQYWAFQDGCKASIYNLQLYLLGVEGEKNLGDGLPELVGERAWDPMTDGKEIELQDAISVIGSGYSDNQISSV